MASADHSLQTHPLTSPKTKPPTIAMAIMLNTLLVGAVLSAAICIPITSGVTRSRLESAQEAARASTLKCDFEAIHGFMTWPAEPSCSYVYMSHGSEFECPHKYDVKLLASFRNATARAQFCSTFHAAQATGKRTDFMLGQQLPPGGLPRIISGESSVLTAGDLFHPSFNAAGTTLDPKMFLPAQDFDVVQVLYAREYNHILETPEALASRYLLFAPSLHHAAAPTLDPFISHYVGGPPTFDAIYGVTYSSDGGSLPPLPSAWPTLVDSVFLPGSMQGGYGLQLGHTYRARAQLRQRVGSENAKEIQWVPIQVLPTHEVYLGHNDSFVLLDSYCPLDSNWTFCQH